MMGLKVMQQVNEDPAAYAAFRRSKDAATGHALESRAPEWYLVNRLCINLIPGTEATSMQQVAATVVIPNEYGEMREGSGIDPDLWMEMADAEEELCTVFDLVTIIAVFNSNGTRVYTPPEEI